MPQQTLWSVSIPLNRTNQTTGLDDLIGSIQFVSQIVKVQLPLR